MLSCIRWENAYELIMPKYSCSFQTTYNKLYGEVVSHLVTLIDTLLRNLNFLKRTRKIDHPGTLYSLQIAMANTQELITVILWVSNLHANVLL